MSNAESSSRARQRIQNRAKIRGRSATPQHRIQRHLGKLLEEQQELQNMLLTHRSRREDMGEESGYDPDPEDCDQEQDTDVDVMPLKAKVEILKEAPQPQPKHVTFADEIQIDLPPTPPLLPTTPLDPSVPPPPALPPRTCPHLHKNNYSRSGATTGSQAPRVGQCTPPKTSGQGYDPPFPYPEFIAKDQESRVNYILTLIDSLILQMERFGKLALNPEGEGAAGSKPSTGAIPKVRSASNNFLGRSVVKSGSRYRSYSKGKHYRKTNTEPEPEFDMDYELCVEQIDEFRNNRVRGCEVCAVVKTLDVIRGHLARADYSDASKLPLKRRSKCKVSSSSSSPTEDMTPSTRPCSPEGYRKYNRSGTDLEQLLDPTTDWPAKSRNASKHQRKMLENLFNMAPPSASTSIISAPRKRHRQYQKGAIPAATVTYPAHRNNNMETALIPCIKKYE